MQRLSECGYLPGWSLSLSMFRNGLVVQRSFRLILPRSPSFSLSNSSWGLKDRWTLSSHYAPSSLYLNFRTSDFRYYFWLTVPAPFRGTYLLANFPSRTFSVVPEFSRSFYFPLSLFHISPLFLLCTCAARVNPLFTFAGTSIVLTSNYPTSSLS